MVVVIIMIVVLMMFVVMVVVVVIILQNQYHHKNNNHYPEPCVVIIEEHKVAPFADIGSAAISACYILLSNSLFGSLYIVSELIHPRATISVFRLPACNNFIYLRFSIRILLHPSQETDNIRILHKKRFMRPSLYPVSASAPILKRTADLPVSSASPFSRQVK